MSQQHVHQPDDREFGKNWVTTSRFMFYMQLIALLAFVTGCSYNIYKESYKGKPNVEVQPSSQYTPQYK